MRKSIPFVDWHGVRRTVTRAQHDSCCTSRSVKREDRLDGDVGSRGIEGLKHDLRHLLAVRLGVEWGLGEKNRVLLRRDAQLIVESVMPNLLHVVPVGDDAVLDGVLERADVSLRLSFIADVAVLLIHARHHVSVTRTPNQGGEDRSGSDVAGEASFAHTRTVVDDQGFSFVVVILFIRSSAQHCGEVESSFSIHMILSERLVQVVERFASEDQMLMAWRDALGVVDEPLDFADGRGRLDGQSGRLNKDLHVCTSEGFQMDFVVGKAHVSGIRERERWYSGTWKLGS
mmetsp:Transcript_10427/g.19962  ORF Transcript_10427/g.19962 Transcript_10427/m.19962 type:complete len:287 (-) Transcript_10427:86-946(-)